MRSGHHHFHLLSVLGAVLLSGLFLYKIVFVNDFFSRLFGGRVPSQAVLYSSLPDSGKKLKQVVIQYPDGRKVSFEVDGTVEVKGSFLKVSIAGKTVVYWLPKGTKVSLRSD